MTSALKTHIPKDSTQRLCLQQGTEKERREGKGVGKREEKKEGRKGKRE